MGWIAVATIANAAQLLYVLGWDGWGLAPVAWTIIMVAAAGPILIRISFVFAAERSWILK